MFGEQMKNVRKMKEEPSTVRAAHPLSPQGQHSFQVNKKILR